MLIQFNINQVKLDMIDSPLRVEIGELDSENPAFRLPQVSIYNHMDVLLCKITAGDMRGSLIEVMPTCKATIDDLSQLVVLLQRIDCPSSAFVDIDKIPIVYKGGSFDNINNLTLIEVDE